MGKIFNKHLVQKEYFCVVSGDLANMKRCSKEIDHTYKVSGMLKNTKLNMKSSNRGTSVAYTPVIQGEGNSSGRICHLEWEHVLTVTNAKDAHLIRVRTSTGAKHQIRAMLAQLVKSPICGDLRYGAKEPLMDKSVALHARKLYLPTLQLGDTDFRNTQFIAPIPDSWSQFFSLTENSIKRQNKDK